MSTTSPDHVGLEWVRFEPESPFAEALPEAETEAQQVGLAWTEAPTPFAESVLGAAPAAEAESLIAEAFAGLRDESFDEALAELVAETEHVMGERFDGETPLALAPDRERLGDAHLAPVAFEAEQFVDRLAESLAGTDLASLSEQQLDELLERTDTPPGHVSPAGEDFIRALANKGRQLAKAAVRAAQSAGSAVGRLVGAALQRLRGLIGPLLRRVLAFAIDRLPAPLRPAAVALAKRFTGEAAAEAELEAEARPVAPAVLTDVEALAESFDAALAEAVAGGEAVVTAELESLGGIETERETAVEGRELETLAAARAQLIDGIAAARQERDLVPVIQQFVPALLMALRIGLRLAGRPRVVQFLARYLAQLISRWVGPDVAGPLSVAVVDTGLRLMTLEHTAAPDRSRANAPALLAATVEDTVRRLAEAEEFALEDEDLVQLAVNEAFEQAVAGTFPAQLVRPDLQIAPSLGGSFVPQHPRRVFAYRKYSRIPEVEVTPQIAGVVRTFGGVTLAAALTAAGQRLPLRARLHIYEATVGTTLHRLARLERGVAGLGSGRARWTALHPLTPEAAGMLLREPRLGVGVPTYYLRSRHRIAVGQRFYYLEPLGGLAPLPVAPVDGRRSCTTPTQGWARIDLIRSEITVALYFSEPDSQSIAAAVNAGRGTLALLRALAGAYDGVARSFSDPNGRVKVIKEMEEGEEFIGPALRRIAPYLLDWLRKKVQEWVLRMLADWARSRSQEFARAAADPRCGVTVTVSLRAVPGLHVLRQALNGQLGAAALRALTPGGLFRGFPSGTVSVVAGTRAL